MISQMADLLIRNVPAQTLEAIKERAKQHGRSVQAEALEALKIGAQPTGIGLVAWLKTVRPPNVMQADIDAFTASIREDRDSR
jgi:plasmid stability protein